MRQTVENLALVIADELSAQFGMRRDLDQLPILVADHILDYFEVIPRAGSTFVDEGNDLGTYEVRARK